MSGRSWQAGQLCGDGKPVGPDRPLERGLGGFKDLTRHHQMPAEEQRSDGHALWCARRPDRSLEKGVGGFKTLGTESQ